MITTQLNNGATVFAEVKHRDEHFVAAEFRGDFVTWRCGPDPQRQGFTACYHGCYFDSKTAALTSLMNRAFPGWEHTEMYTEGS